MTIGGSIKRMNPGSRTEDAGRDRPALLIMRTNIAGKSDFRKVRRLLMTIPEIVDVTIYLDDCDKIMRVRCPVSCVDEVMGSLSRTRFNCTELED